METDDPRPDEEPEDPWDGPSPEAPEPEQEEDYRKHELPPGPNELRVVTKIEEYTRNSRGPRIQVIKSRDIKNAEHFSYKVFRVLKSRGYEIEELTPESLKGEPDGTNQDQKLIYSIDEETIRQFLGSNLNQSDKPMKFLFDNSMLAYVRSPVVISTVSDEFYDRVGMQSFTSERPSATKTREKKKVSSDTSPVNRLAIWSFYFAAASFAIGAANSLLGNFMIFTYNGIQYTPFPAALLILSVIAIAVRSFSLSREDRGSMSLIISSIVLFILFLLFGIMSSYSMIGQNYWPNNLANTILNSGSFTLVLIAAVVFALAVARYSIFLGKSSGKAAYVLSIAGSILLVSAALTYNMPYITIFGQTVYNQANIGAAVVLNQFSFNPSQPFFGTEAYYTIQGTAQYLLLRNWILFIANILLSFSFIQAIRAQKSSADTLDDFQ